MFEKKTAVIYISKKKIKVYQVIKGAKTKVALLLDNVWTEESLSGLLVSLKKKTGKDVRLMLDNSLVFTTCVFVPDGTADLREFARVKTQEMVPENFEDIIWDYKKVDYQKGLNQKENTETIEIMAVEKTFLEKLKESFSKSGFHIEAVESVSLAIAHLISDGEKPVMVISREDNYSLTVVHKGLVFLSEDLSSIPDQEKMDKINSFLLEHYGIKFSRIITSSTVNISEVKLMENAGLKVEAVYLIPAVGLAGKTDLTGEDRLVLNLDLVNSNSQYESKNSSGNITAFVTYFLISMLVAAGGGIILINYFQSSETKNNLKEVIVIPTFQPTINTATVSATPDRAKYSISVLNGSKTDGAAGKLSEILKAGGFNVIKIGNAKTNGFTKTLLEYNAKVGEDYLLTLDKQLKVNYADYESKKLEATGAADIIITIGGI